MTRYDAVNFIAHGVAKDPSYGETRPVTGATEGEDEPQAQQARPIRRRTEGIALAKYCVDLNAKAREGRCRSADRPRPRGRTLHPGAVPPAQEQPAAGGRSRRRQDRHRRGPGQEDRRGRNARGAAGRHDLLARHGRAAGRHALSRRFRGAAEGRGEGARGSPRRDPLHRRDPHRDRRRRDLRRGDGRLQPAEAGASGRQAALHGLDHLQGIPPAFRKGPRAAAGSRRST
jgi:hypothetical protein